MSSPGEQRVALTCHPSTPCDAVRRADVRVRRTAYGVLVLSYRLEADLARVRIPPAASPHRTAELWRHTCFEAFIAQSGAPAYCEFNFAPSTQWAAYRFNGYREGMAALEEQWQPAVVVRSSGDAVQLDAAVRPQCLGGLESRATVRLALSAVIEEHDGRLSYWALRHAPERPDFHHPGSFALEL